MAISRYGMTSRPTVAIVGCGFSGTMVAVHLACLVSRGARILIFERDRRFARGPAYGTTSPDHLLNVPARLMSAFPDQPDHFLDWLRARDPAAEGGTFVPRRVYGDYLEGLLREAVERPGSPLLPIRGEIADLHEGPSGGFTLLSCEGDQFHAHVVVLAMGNPGPRDPIAVPESLRASGAYVGNPWAQDGLEGLTGDESLVLIGAGLTAVDLVVEAESRGTVGTITAVSRHGLLPHCHAPAPPLPSPIPDLDSEREFSPRRLLREIRGAVRRAEREGGNWRSVIDAIRPDIPRLWGGLDEVQKRSFLRHLAAYWDIHRHRLAPEIGAILRRARSEGRFRVLAGRIIELEDLRGKGVSVVVRRRGQSSSESVIASRVINCTGPSRDLSTGFPPLVGNLCDRGLARPDPLGMGLEVDSVRHLEASRPGGRWTTLRRGPASQGPVLGNDRRARTETAGRRPGPQCRRNPAGSARIDCPGGTTALPHAVRTGRMKRLGVGHLGRGRPLLISVNPD